MPYLPVWLMAIALCYSVQSQAQTRGRTPVFQETDSVWFQQHFKRGELVPITLQLGPGDYGIGLQVRW